jgi:hypothetical protein
MTASCASTEYKTDNSNRRREAWLSYGHKLGPGHPVMQPRIWRPIGVLGWSKHAHWALDRLADSILDAQPNTFWL